MSAEYYKKRILECANSAKDFELKAENEMKSGSDAQATEYMRLADMENINVRNYREGLQSMTKEGAAL